MLRSLLSLTLLSCLLHGQAQEITLTFTGQYQGDPVSLDSVLVVNLTPHLARASTLVLSLAKPTMWHERRRSRQFRVVQTNNYAHWSSGSPAGDR